MASNAEPADTTRPVQQPREPPWAEETGVWASYDVHCHCGKVRYSIKLSPPIYEDQSEGKGTSTVIICNCSWCERNGLQLVYPLAENVTCTKGLEEVSSYSFASKRVEHRLCKHCGSVVGSDASKVMESVGQAPRWAINVRMLKHYDPAKLRFKAVSHMKDVPPLYNVED